MMMQMIGSFAEFERAMLRERTRAGLESARGEGRIGGRRPKAAASATDRGAEDGQTGQEDCGGCGQTIQCPSRDDWPTARTDRRRCCRRQKVGRRMALRELLSFSQREAFEAAPLDRAGLIEHYVLSDQDLSLIRRRRGAQNRLGLAAQLAFLRYPGRALLPSETPPPELLTFLARQLNLSPSAWGQLCRTR